MDQLKYYLLFDISNGFLGLKDIKLVSSTTGPSKVAKELFERPLILDPIGCNISVPCIFGKPYILQRELDKHDFRELNIDLPRIIVRLNPEEE